MLMSLFLRWGLLVIEITQTRAEGMLDRQRLLEGDKRLTIV